MPKNQAAVELAKRRAAKLSPARRKEISALAAKARWANSTVASRRKSLAPAIRALAKSRKQQVLHKPKATVSENN